KMPGSTLSRCAPVVELKKKKKDELVEDFKHEDDIELADLRRRLRGWSMDNADLLRDAKPSMPDQFSNRRKDNWKIAFAIADLCGLDWGDKAREAAVYLEGASDIRSASVKALAVLKAVFDANGGDVVFSEEVIENLISDPTSEWAEWRSGKPITQVQLARLLS